MCGIFGVYQTPELTLDRSVAAKMGAAIAHRGPDGNGVFEDRSILLGMQRLAIIDVAGGQQPLYNEDQSVVVVCNGEIYNFRELRDDLIGLGHRFATRSDSEVIVHLYEEYGSDCVKRLRGMFGLAIWDRRASRLIIARDPLGIKPLYVRVESNRVLFASELKSILEVPGVERKISAAALREYLALGYVPAPLTMLEGIQKLPPGHTLIADSSGTTTQRYWEPPQPSVEEVEWPELIAHTMEGAVVSQMVSDVPLGAFLSGGVDSSAVVAFMAKNSMHPVKTYSIGFDVGTGGSYYSELPYARRVAELFKTDHHEIVVRPDVTALLPELLWHMDEPIADAAFITTYLVSKFAREDVTVILSGVGGDELFGGYRRYWSDHLAQQYRRIPKALRQFVIQPTAKLFPSDRHSRLFDWFRLAKGFIAGAELEADERYEEYIRVFKKGDLGKILGSPAEYRSAALEAAFSAADDGDPVQRLIEVDLQTQLPDDLLVLTDKMSMAASLECRVPLLDDSLVELSMGMPSSLKVSGRNLKVGMKAALRGVLPDDIIDRKKRGFGAPIGGWFKRELASFLDTVLSESAIRNRGVFEWEHLEAMKAQHRANRQDYTDHLLAVMNFELWCQIYLDGDSHAEVAERLASAA